MQNPDLAVCIKREIQKIKNFNADLSVLKVNLNYENQIRRLSVLYRYVRKRICKIVLVISSLFLPIIERHFFQILFWISQKNRNDGNKDGVFGVKIGSWISCVVENLFQKLNPDFLIECTLNFSQRSLLNLIQDNLLSG